MERQSAWSGLFVPREVMRALDELGFGHPTPIQAAVLPAAVRGRVDVLGAAETGDDPTNIGIARVTLSVATLVVVSDGRGRHLGCD